MISGRRHLERAAPDVALARGQVLWRSVTPERPVVLYGAELESPALCLGAYQHGGHALARGALEGGRMLLRRRTGGVALQLGPGTVYLAIGLLGPSSMMACPPGKLLNRNVRGTLTGLRQLKLPAHYFGRDFVSVERRPASYVAWSEAADGRALVELFVAVTKSVVLPASLDAYPERSEPVFRGKAPITLAEAGCTTGGEEVLEALVAGHARCYGLELEDAPPSAQEHGEAEVVLPRLRASEPEDLCWSDPLEEAIGFVGAGAALNDAGRLSALRIAGDLMQHEGCPVALAEALLGTEPTARGIGGALDRIYAERPGLIEGVRSLGSLQQALLDAVAHARERRV